MEQLEMIKVFLSSPMDVAEERNAVRNKITQINDIIGKKVGITFEVVSWEDYVTPDMGVDAQDVVNQQITMDYDIFLGIFKNRVGTPTKRFSSGTIEEYERAKMLRSTKPDLQIMFYFIGNSTSDEVIEFKQTIAQEGVLYAEARDTEDFESNIYKHFVSILLSRSKQILQRKKDKHSNDTINQSVAVAIISQEKLLVVKRSMKSRHGGGFWQIPGGKVDGEEDLTDAAVREIGEELSIVLQKELLEPIGVFYDTDISNKSRKIAINLFLYTISHDNNSINIILNDENEKWQWIDLSRPSMNNASFFGVNKRMVISIWREIAVARKLEQLLSNYDDSSDEFPNEISGVNPAELNTIYGMLSILGLIRCSNHITSVSNYSKGIIHAFVSISRAGNEIFKNDNIDHTNRLNLQKSDYSLLKMNQSKMMYSHRALLSTLSSITELRESVRNICDVLIFGTFQSRTYILLRWDFYASKYQLISSGLEIEHKLGNYEENAKHVIAKRFGNALNGLMDYYGVGQFSTKHFSAGSLNNDPILRTYNIDVVMANSKKQNGDIGLIIQSINETTNLRIEFSDNVSREDAKRLLFFRWCDLETLLERGNTYYGRNVQGIDELITNIGKSAIMSHIQNPIEIDTLQIDEEFTQMINGFTSKLVDE